jgi:hypothetical protein
LPWEVVGVFYSCVGVAALCNPPKDTKALIFLKVPFSFTLPDFFTAVSASSPFAMRQNAMKWLIFIKVPFLFSLSEFLTVFLKPSCRPDPESELSY